MLRWLRTLNAYACCAMAPGAWMASAAPSRVAVRAITFRIMSKLPSKRLSPAASNRHLQEQHRPIQHEQRAHHPQHAFARDVQVHLVADVQAERHGQQPKRIGDLQLRVEQQAGKEEQRKPEAAI